MTERPGARLVVTVTGWASTLQDHGRMGWSHVGVGRSGVMDRRSAALANRLVGNPERAVVVETVGGLSLRAEGVVAVAITGARSPVRVDGTPVAWDAPVLVASGSEVSLGVAGPGQGRWSYVAVRGGLVEAEALGSCAQDTLSGLGPPPLVVGRTLQVGEASVGGILVDVAAVAPWPDGVVTVRVWPGPHRHRLPEAWDRLLEATWRVGHDSDRVGYRLDNAELVTHAQGDGPSVALVAGAVQLPGDGRPIVMMRDHPTTGGYPVIAVVDPDDLGALAQRRGGEEVRMVPVEGGPTPLETSPRHPPA